MKSKLIILFIFFCLAGNAQSNSNLSIEKIIGEWKVCRTNWLDSSFHYRFVTNRFLENGVYEQPNIYYKACLGCPTEIITMRGRWYLTGNTVCIEADYEGKKYTRKILNAQLKDSVSFSGIEKRPGETEWPLWFADYQPTRTIFVRAPTTSASKISPCEQTNKRLPDECIEL